MAIDRSATLRNAEKLLRQGKLDAAIAEYARIVEEYPRDWNTANILGDLYVRAGQIEKAVEQYTRIAAHLNDEGFFPKAAALYKKVLKLNPQDEHALLQAAEIATTQGLLADARSYLNTIADLRIGRGDKAGAAQVRIRLGTLDPGDFAGRSIAARARVEIGDTTGAVNDLKTIAAELSDKGRAAEALDALRQAAEIDPGNDEVRARLLQVYLAAGDLDRARESASTVDQLKAVAAALESAGRPDDALKVLAEAARRDPALDDLREQVARRFIARGDVGAAAEYLTPEIAGRDPKLRLALIEIDLKAGRVDEALALAHDLLELDPTQHQAIALLAWSLAAHEPGPAFMLAEAAADASIAASDWAAAAATLQEFVTRVPNHVPALMRLVEICVDGGLEATMYSAQGQLADAYISAGSAAEARVIAEDLVAREPWDRSNIERFRKALTLLGDGDPDALIAARLSGESPFTSTDLTIDFSDLPPFEEPKAAPAVTTAPSPAPEPKLTPIEASKAAASTTGATPGGASKHPPRKGVATKTADDGGQFSLGANSIDLKAILSELEADPQSSSRAGHEHGEVDLSVVLDEIQKAEQPEAPLDIDQVFAQLRDEAGRNSAMAGAEEHFTRGVALNDAGQIDDAIPELEAAARAPRLRFAAASLLGRIARTRGNPVLAAEWLERAAQAPAPTVDEGHELLYELADALESAGEIARALAVCLELQADAGDYRDVRARADRLARVQSRG